MAAAKSKSTRKKRKCKSRKKHVQQMLFRRGGRRRGAGRKSKKARPGRRHARRPDFSARHPLHVVLRVDPAVRTLRRRAMYKAIREATLTAVQRQRIRIIHISLQRLHIHMLVEAADRHALSRGMQGFQISAARYINSALGRELVRVEGATHPERPGPAELVHLEGATHPERPGPAELVRVEDATHRERPGPAELVRVEGATHREYASAAKRGRGSRRRAPRRCGRVFVDRYYTEVITSPTQAHHALQYCLSNWRRHGEDRHGVASTWLVDPFSSAIVFPDWLELADKAFMWPIRETYDPMLVYLPTTWLLKEGWKLVGPISARTTPGGKRQGPPNG